MDIFKELYIESTNLGVSTGENLWFTHPQSKKITSENPSTGKILASIEVADENLYEGFIQKASEGFKSWRNIPAPQRGLIIREIAEEFRLHKEALGTLISLEMGKSKQEGLGEVQEMIDIADYAVGLSRSFGGKTLPSERVEHRLMEQWHPLGIIGVITAFNFPMAVWAWNALIGAVCGDVIIWKPSSKTPLCAIAVQHICNRVISRFQLKGVFNLWITPESSLIEKLLDDPRIPLISFTGSTFTGKKVAERVAKRLGKTLLELGGNNALIVDETADFQQAVPAIVFGAIGTSGQRCTSIRRLLVHESKYNELIQRIQKAYAQIPIGNPLDDSHLMGPLIDAEAVKLYEKVIHRAKILGGTVLYGGNILDKEGYFVEPTLIQAENHWDIVQEETFAPILYVMPYKTIEEAIHLQNSVKQGLSSALFTQNMRHMELFLSHLGSDCGLANINTGTSGAEIGGAFGGEKETGGGRESGSDSWKAYMRRQTNVINWGKALPLAQGISFDIENP